MVKQDHHNQDVCPKCGALTSESLQYCPTCRTDVGAPNVRASRTEENLRALDERYNSQKSQAIEEGHSEEFSALENVVMEESGVVVSMSPAMARKMLEDPRTIYANYEKLVGVGARKPATLENDRHRCAVGGILFGSYADSIHYGLLSLTNYGLPTYGAVHCRLRAVTIEDRTSFLETNSYKFCEDHSLVPGGEKPPNGYTACWENRHKLVLSKLSGNLFKGQKKSEWQSILVQSDGKNREKDEFVEALIYNSFDSNAIEHMVENEGEELTRAEKLDMDLAIFQFNKIRGQGK